MAKTGVRVAITLACTECKRRNYQTMKSKRNTPDRVEFRKYCRWCGTHTAAPGDALDVRADQTAGSRRAAREQRDVIARPQPRRDAAGRGAALELHRRVLGGAEEGRVAGPEPGDPGHRRRARRLRRRRRVTSTSTTRSGSKSCPRSSSVSKESQCFAGMSSTPTPGHENKVKANLEHRIESMGQRPRFRRVVVPTEQVIETKDGQKVQAEKRVLPGLRAREHGPERRRLDGREEHAGRHRLRRRRLQAGAALAARGRPDPEDRRRRRRPRRAPRSSSRSASRSR